MEPWIQTLITIVCTVLASSGFWAYIQKKGDTSNAEKRLLIGLAHDRIVGLCMRYIDRGWITQDEYENLHDYLYIPYTDVADDIRSVNKLMKDVENLPVHKTEYKSKER